MTAHWAALALPFLLGTATMYVAYRLRFFSESGLAGRYPFWSGSSLILLSSVWHAIATTPGYDRWFVITAYRTLDFLEFIALLAGLILVALGLHRYTEHRRRYTEELKTLEAKLAIQENLHHEARGHYQLLELLNITLKELLVHFPSSAGAAFLINRGKRQLVLGAGLGLTKNETARLEQYPLGRNLLTQAVEDGAPVIAGGFEFVDEQGKGSESRFGSSLVLPLASGGERIGAVMLLAEPSRAFGRLDVRYLMPVAQWLAERILATRLGREVSTLKLQIEAATKESEDTSALLHSLLQGLTSPDADSIVCKCLIGIYGALSVHLCGLQSGKLQITGGNGHADDFSESLRIALIEAIERRKPLIINQETTDQAGRSIVVRSNLLVPVMSEPYPISLLLRKDGTPFEVGEKELAKIGLYGQVVRAALNQSEIIRRDISRRSGFDKVISLLSESPEGKSPEILLSYFLKRIYEILPANSIALAVRRREDASFNIAGVLGAEVAPLRQMVIVTGESIVSSVGANCEPHFAIGKKNVHAALESFHPENRLILNKLFDENRTPSFASFCPITQSDSLVGVVVFFLTKATPDESAEWERLLTLASSLYSLRLSVDIVRDSRGYGTDTFALAETPRVVNDVNNHLSAVIGMAGLALGQEQLSGDMKTDLGNIIAEAEHAADLLKKLSTERRTYSGQTGLPISKDEDFNAAIESVLQSSRISGDLYMAGGRAREIVRRFDRVGQLALATSTVRDFFESVLDRFASAVPDDDMMTISTYEKDRYVFLDISRHRRNFPPVDHVSSFGDYELADLAVRSRPTDVFLSHIAADTCYYAYDRIGSTPAYLSFKFPLKSAHSSKSSSQGESKLNILAVDDQSVILDLIVAMCQSTGHRITTARSGDEGLRAASAERFDLVLTDLSMPDMSGLEVAKRIHKQYPGTKIVLITGWESGLDSSSLHTSGISQVLNKPFRIEQLAEVIKSASERIAS